MTHEEMESKDKTLLQQIEQNHIIAINRQTKRKIWNCPDNMWLIAREAWLRNPDIMPEPFPEGHIIFEGKSFCWDIIVGQMPMVLEGGE